MYKFAFILMFLAGSLFFPHVSQASDIEFFQATTTTLSITTDGEQEVMIWAKGSVQTPGGSTGDTYCTYLRYDGGQIDSICNNGGQEKRDGFALQHYFVPPAGTENITVTTDADISLVKITAMISSASSGGGSSSPYIIDVGSTLMLGGILAFFIAYWLVGLTRTKKSWI